MSTFLPCLPLCDKKGLQRGSQAPQDPLLLPPTSPATPFGTAIGQLVLDIVCATGVVMAPDAQPLSKWAWWEKAQSFRLVGSFSKKALKGGVTGSPEPLPSPHTHTHTNALWHSYWVAHFRQYVKPLSKWAPQEKAQSYRPVGLFSFSELTWGQCERHESSHWNCHIYSQTNKVILAAPLSKWPRWEKAQSSKPVRSFSISKFIWGRPLYETWELLLEPLYLQKN